MAHTTAGYLPDHRMCEVLGYGISVIQKTEIRFLLSGPSALCLVNSPRLDQCCDGEYVLQRESQC